jgi:hypothetical protein
MSKHDQQQISLCIKTYVLLLAVIVNSYIVAAILLFGSLFSLFVKSHFVQVYNDIYLFLTYCDLQFIAFDLILIKRHMDFFVY